MDQKQYKEYLQSSLWKNIREKALFRDNGWCQGCLENRATQVHHLSYDHVGFEFLHELISLCEDCHTRIHSKEE